MAAWQFTIELIPSSATIQTLARLEVIPDDFDVESVWTAHSRAVDVLANKIDKLLVRAQPWHDEQYLWGDARTDDVQLTFSADRIHSLTARLDCRDLSIEFIAAIAIIACAGELSVWLPESRKIIFAPNIDLLWNAAERSKAMAFAAPAEGNA